MNRAERRAVKYNPYRLRLMDASRFDSKTVPVGSNPRQTKMSAERVNDLKVVSEEIMEAHNG